MRRIGSRAIVAALMAAACTVVALPAAAENSGPGASARTTHELAAQSSRPSITIYPRQNQAGRNSVRQCRAQLVKEYRVSGTVIVPRMHCWWE